MNAINLPPEPHERGASLEALVPLDAGAEADGYRYKAFISYAHADEPFATQLHRRLENYRIPGRLLNQVGGGERRLGTFFRDRDELGSASSLTGAIQDALTESEYLIVLCSPSAAASEWVNQEVMLFQKLRGPEHILLIVSPLAGDVKPLACFPAVVIETTDEPLAADARRSADGRRRGVLKIIAALLGVRFDELERREVSQRRRKLAGVMVSVALAVSIVALLLIQRDQANREASSHRDQATALVGYLVTDLDRRLEEYQKLGELDAGLKQALSFFETIDLDEVDAPVLDKYRTAIRGVGRVHLRQGDIEAARDAFQRAAAVGEELVDRDAGNPKYWSEYATNAYFIGEAYWEMMDFVEAARRIEQALGFARQAAALAPEAYDEAYQVIFALNNVGAVNTRLQRYDVATNALLEALSRLELLQAVDNEHAVELLEQEVEAVSWLAEISATTGRFDEAFGWHEREIDRREQLIERTDSNQHTARLSDALGYYAKTLAMVGRTADAIAVLERKITLADSLIVNDPDNNFWRVRRPKGRMLLATQRFAAGDRVGAQALLDQAAREFADYLEQDLFTRSVTYDMWTVRLHGAYFQLDDRPDVASLAASRILEETDAEIALGGVSNLLLATRLRAVTLQAAAMRAAGRPVDVDAAREGLELLDEFGHPEFSVVDAIYECLMLLASGDAQADQAIVRLEALGVRSLFFLDMVARLRA